MTRAKINALAMTIIVGGAMALSSAVAQAQEVIADRDDSTKQYCCEGPTCKCCGDGGATCDARGCICR